MPHAERNARTPAVTQSSGEADAPDRAAHMQATFWLAVAARDAVIAGELEAAKPCADVLADHDFGDLRPRDWQHSH